MWRSAPVTGRRHGEAFARVGLDDDEDEDEDEDEDTALQDEDDGPIARAAIIAVGIATGGAV